MVKAVSEMPGAEDGETKMDTIKKVMKKVKKAAPMKAKARRGKLSAPVDISAIAPNSEAAVVYRIRKPGEKPTMPADSDDEGPASSTVLQKKKKAKAGVNFLQQKRDEKAKRRQEKEQEATKGIPKMDELPFVHLKIKCDPVGIVNALVKNHFPDARTWEIAPRMNCAWLMYDDEVAANERVNEGNVMMCGFEAKVAKGKKAPEEVFVSLNGECFPHIPQIFTHTCTTLLGGGRVFSGVASGMRYQ